MTTTSPSGCSTTSLPRSAIGRLTGPGCSGNWPPAAIRAWASARSTFSCRGRLPRDSSRACRTAATGRPVRRPASTPNWPWPCWPVATWPGTGCRPRRTSHRGPACRSARLAGPSPPWGPTEAVGELLALPGTLDAPPPPAPPALLLAGGEYRHARLPHPRAAGRDRRRPHYPARRGTPRPAVLIDGLAAGTWTLTTKGKRRCVTIVWFRRPAESLELRAEQFSVESFLGSG